MALGSWLFDAEAEEDHDLRGDSDQEKHPKIVVRICQEPDEDRAENRPDQNADEHEIVFFYSPNRVENEQNDARDRNAKYKAEPEIDLKYRGDRVDRGRKRPKASDGDKRNEDSVVANGVRTLDLLAGKMTANKVVKRNAKEIGDRLERYNVGQGFASFPL